MAASRCPDRAGNLSLTASSDKLRVEAMLIAQSARLDSAADRGRMVNGDGELVERDWLDGGERSWTARIDAIWSPGSPAVSGCMAGA
jgi:hypothetical protein